MMNLKLKEEYQNSIVRRGKISFNSETVPMEHYSFYYKNGFADLFDVNAPKSVKPKK